MKSSIQAESPRRVYVSDFFVVVTAGIGLLLSTLDTGIINVAIPTLVAVFHSTVTGIAWTVTLYTLALTGTIVLFGRISDRIGHLRVYTFGLVVFASSSALCGFSQSVVELIEFRILQGIGAAMLQATSVAIITTVVPPGQTRTCAGDTRYSNGGGSSPRTKCGWCPDFARQLEVDFLAEHSRCLGCAYRLRSSEEADSRSAQVRSS